MRLTPRQQGDRGETSALDWLCSQGYPTGIPFGSSPDWDLIAEIDGVLQRVQVKTSTQRTAAGRWQVTLCTRGGNRSWGGVVKRFSSERCDWLFVLLGDGRRYFLPAKVVEGSTGITLGGPKYAAFEVDPGVPLPLADAA